MVINIIAVAVAMNDSNKEHKYKKMCFLVLIAELFMSRTFFLNVQIYKQVTQKFYLCE